MDQTNYDNKQHYYDYLRKNDLGQVQFDVDFDIPEEDIEETKEQFPQPQEKRGLSEFQKESLSQLLINEDNIKNIVQDAITSGISITNRFDNQSLRNLLVYSENHASFNVQIVTTTNLFNFNDFYQSFLKQSKQDNLNIEGVELGVYYLKTLITYLLFQQK